MTPLIAPYRQGELDGLCGVYAIVNALRLVLESHPAGFTRRDWEQLFHTLLATIDNGRGGVCHVVANGMSARRFRKVAKSATLHMHEEHALDVSIEPLFARDDRPTTDGLFVAIAKSTESGEPVIADFAGRLNHWTVIRAVTQQSLLLFDSGGLFRVARRNCQLVKHRGSKRHLHSLSTHGILRVRCLWR